MRNVVAYKRQYARIMQVTRAKEFMTKAAAPCSEFAWVAATVLLVLRVVFYGSCFVHGMRWDCILICYIWEWKRKWLPSLLRWEYLNDQFGCQILRHFEGRNLTKYSIAWFCWIYYFTYLRTYAKYSLNKCNLNCIKFIIVLTRFNEQRIKEFQLLKCCKT